LFVGDHIPDISHTNYMTPWYIDRSKNEHFPFRAARRLPDRGLDPAVALNSFESLLRAAEKAVQPVPERPRSDGGAGRCFALRFQCFYGQHVRRNRSKVLWHIPRWVCSAVGSFQQHEGIWWFTCPNSGNWALLAKFHPEPLKSIVSGGQISSKFVLTWRSMLVLGLCSELTNQLGPLDPRNSKGFSKDWQCVLAVPRGCEVWWAVP
jgi:hypothetical protein